MSVYEIGMSLFMCVCVCMHSHMRNVGGGGGVGISRLSKLLLALKWVFAHEIHYCGNQDP
jgi:hypothetical protein